MSYSPNRQQIRFQKVINLTDHPISFYDSEGNIATCDPWQNSDSPSQLDRKTMVIVEDIVDADVNNIPHECAVVAETPGIGRGNIEVYRLTRLHDDAPATINAPRTPKGETYHI